jgi:hypothetical protein
MARSRELSKIFSSDTPIVLENELNTTLESYVDKEQAQAPFRNLIINGAMQVAQRGTSVTGITGVGYNTADRFQIVASSLGTWTQSVENDAPTGSGFRKSLKMLCTTADAAPASSDLLKLNHNIEGQNLQAIRKGTSSAQQLTLSFWVKSNATGTYIVELNDNDNTRSVSAAYSIASSGTWEKKTIVFPADTTGAFDNDNALSLQLGFFLGSGTDRTSGTLQTSWGSEVAVNRAVGQTNLAAATNNYWQITGVQLEVGAVATPFEFKPFEQELRECQRYYEKSYNVETPVGTNTSTGSQRLTIAQNNVYARALILFKVPKRAAPTVTFWANDGTSNTWNWDLIGTGSENRTITGTFPETHSVMFETNGITSTRNNAIGQWAASIEI